MNMRSASEKTLLTTFILFLTLAIIPAGFAAANDAVKLTVLTDRPDALYQCGEKATFTIAVTKEDQPVTTGSVDLLVTLDGGKEIRRETIQLDGPTSTLEGTLDHPGFLRVSVTHQADGKAYRGLGAAGFDPEKIRTRTPEPDDFDAFWADGKQRLAAIPLDLRMEKLAKQSSDQVDAFAISFANIDNTRIYGFLCVPKGRPGPFPAWVTVPGAGPGPFGPSGTGYAERGVLALTMGVHAYDVGSMTREEIKQAYAELNSTLRYPLQGAPKREDYYFRRTYLGIDRAISWLAARPDFDGEHMVIDGSSQGGASALILTGLNPAITATAANVPALCDHGGYLADRAPGWPKLIQIADEDEKDEYLRMAAYFDAVNFARRITRPVIVSVGFIDGTCSPSSVYSAYNALPSPKRIFNGPLNGHEWNVGTYRSFLGPWVEGQLGLTDPVEPTGE